MRPSFLPSLLLLVTAAALAGRSRAIDYDVYLLGGQSNMLGRAATSGLPASLQQPQNDVTFYLRDPGSPSTGKYNTLVPLQPLTTSGSTFGPEITFGRTMADQHPDQHLALLKYASSGTNLAVNWAPGTGADYQAFMSTMSSGLAALTAGGNTYHIDGMLWLQGESDTGTQAQQYQANLTNFIADMRSHFGANLPFVIGGIGYQTADYTVVSAAQQRVAQTVPNVAYFSDYDLLGPNHTDLHFDAADQQLIGQRYVTALQALPEPSCLAAFGVAAVVGLTRRRRA